MGCAVAAAAAFGGRRERAGQAKARGGQLESGSKSDKRRQRRGCGQRTALSPPFSSVFPFAVSAVGCCSLRRGSKNSLVRNEREGTGQAAAALLLPSVRSWCVPAVSPHAR
jgi:hypothetical protein